MLLAEIEAERDRYLDARDALEAEYAGRYAAMAAQYQRKFIPRNGDSRALYDALALTCMASAWAPFEVELREKSEQLFAAYRERVKQIREGKPCIPPSS